MAGHSIFNKSKRFYIISGIVLVIIIAGVLVWRNFKYKFVNKKIDQLVEVKSRGLYEVNYQNLVIDEAGGNITAENVEMLYLVKPSFSFTVFVARTLTMIIFYFSLSIIQIFAN